MENHWLTSHERWIHSDGLQAQGGEVATESPPVKAKPKAETATATEAKDGGENGVGTAVKWLGFVEGRPACSRISGF